MRMRMLIAAAILVCAAGASAAQNALPEDRLAPPGAESRYTFKQVDNGFIRLDGKSGEVAFCSLHGSAWACETAPEDRAALEKEIARLQNEVASLKAQVAVLRTPSGPAAAAPADKPREYTIKLPSEQDIARARAYLKQTWRRVVDMISNLQKDVLHKG